jgi:hypothetical protein
MTEHHRCPACNADLPFGKLATECPKCGADLRADRLLRSFVDGARSDASPPGMINGRVSLLGQVLMSIMKRLFLCVLIAGIAVFLAIASAIPYGGGSGQLILLAWAAVLLGPIWVLYPLTQFFSQPAANDQVDHSQLADASTFFAPKFRVTRLLVAGVAVGVWISFMLYWLRDDDRHATEVAESDANRILAAHTAPIPVRGLYTGSMNLHAALYGMLVESRLPFIEIRSDSGAAWLLTLVKDSQPLINQTEQYRYIRLSLGKQGAPNCLTWLSSVEDWTTGPPVRPHTCVLAQFTNDIESDIELHVDASKASSRRLSWELIDRAKGKLLLSIPFWQRQNEGQPLQVDATYRSADEDYTFIRVLRTLLPLAVPRDQDGRPYVMNRIDEPSSNESVVEQTKIRGEFRAPRLDWAAFETPRTDQSWSDAYAKAFNTGKPVIINNNYLVIPGSDKVGYACANPARNNCSFANSFVSDIGVLTVHGEASQEAFKDANLPAQGMVVTVAARNFSGKLLWFVSINPGSLPLSHQHCKDFSLKCAFYPLNATTTAQELVIRGTLVDRKLLRQEYELVVPLAELPRVQVR